LAVEELNHKGGLLGRQVELIELDNKNTPIGSRLAAQKAVQAGVIAVLAPFSSSHSLLAGELLQKAKIPMISSTSTNPEVTRIGNYIFRVCFTDGIQGEILTEFAVDDLKAGKLFSSALSMTRSSFWPTPHPGRTPWPRP